MPNPFRSFVKTIFGFAAVLVPALVAGTAMLNLGGCAFQDQRLKMADYAATGRYDIAAKELDTPSVQSLYGDNSKLLWLLDRGSIAFALGDDKRAFATWEEADKIMDLWREQPLGDTVASWLLNDEVTNYIAAPYEDMYVNAMKLLVNLRLGRIEGGATVEARRAAGKANLLRDRYLKFDSALRQKDSKAYSQAVAGMPTNLFAEATSGGQFIESPLATYLSAVTFAKSGEPENQAVAARRLTEILSAQGSLVGNVNPADFATMGDLQQDSANVLLVAFAGRAPIKVPERIGPIPIYTYPLYIELPKLKTWVSEVRSVRAIAERITPATTPGPQLTITPASADNRIETPMPLIEDLGRVAEVNHQRERPQIYARGIIRSSIKAAASAVATEAVRQSTRNSKYGGLATIGSVLAGLIFVTATERADLRTWAFLPGTAHVQLLSLPPGTWRIHMEYQGGAGGTVFTTPSETVTISGEPTQLATVIGHYWR